MANLIETNTGTMKTDVESIRAELKNIDSIKTKLADEVSRLGSMWEGDAKSVFMAGFQSDLGELEEMIKAYTEMTDSTDEARSDYEKCESNVADIVSSIQI